MRRNALVAVFAAGLLIWYASPGWSEIIVSGETKKETRATKADAKVAQQELQVSIKSGNVISMQKFREGLKDGFNIEEGASPEKFDSGKGSNADNVMPRKGRLIPAPVSRE